MGRFSAKADRSGRCGALSASQPSDRSVGAQSARAVSGDAQPERHATELFRDTIDFVEQDLTLDVRRCVPDALLSIALARLIARDGRGETVAILTGLADAISSGAILSAGWPARPGRTGGSARPGSRPAESGTVIYLR